MDSRSPIRSVLPIVAGVIAGMISYFATGTLNKYLARDDWDAFYGLTPEESGYRLLSPMSKINLTEVGLGTTGDGSLNYFGVWIDPGTEVEATFHKEDIDGDGKFDTI